MCSIRSFSHDPGETKYVYSFSPIVTLSHQLFTNIRGLGTYYHMVSGQSAEQVTDFFYSESPGITL